MKQYVTAMPKDRECFKYLCEKFPRTSEVWLKEGVFVGPDILKMMIDTNFETKMTTEEDEVWKSFKQVVTKWSQLRVDCG